jgi:ribonuclease-3
MAIKKLRIDKEFQETISELKKKQNGEMPEEHEFEELPEDLDSEIVN